MKKTFLFSLAIATLVFSGCNTEGKDNGDASSSDEKKLSTEVVQTDKKPKMVFEQTVFNFGEIVDGEKVRTEFVFTNTGDGPLVISNGVASCGCTKPKWPEEPIAPGEKGKIEVTFDSAGKEGHVVKDITITANTEPRDNKLQIVGDVVKQQN